MAVAGDLHQQYRYPYSKSVDAVRWLYHLSAFDRLIAAAVYDSSSFSSSVEILALNPIPNHANPNPSNPPLHLRSTWPSRSRISSLRTSGADQKHAVAALSTFAGSVHLLFVDPLDGSVRSELSTDEIHPLHKGSSSSVDLQIGGHECLTAGEDGRVNLVSAGEGKLDTRLVDDNRGLLSYTAVKWGSPEEFVTGGYGFGLQWWDQRKPGGVVSQFKGNWVHENMTGIVHSIDIHPSKKHISVVGGSSGTVFAWDLRQPRQPIILARVGLNGAKQSAFESEVWEIRYDMNAQFSDINSASSAKILPVMACSEDGVLAVIEQGKPPIELLAEDCAINSIDIDPQSPSDVILSLESESIGILMRSKEMAQAF